MKLRRLCLGLILALLLARPSPGQELSPETVQQAIDAGLTWLRTQQDASGAFSKGVGRYEEGYPLGRTALATLALLKCGVPPDDPQVERAFEFLRASPLHRTYGVCLLILAIEARYAPDPAEVEKQEAKRSYTAVAGRAFQKQARPEDRAALEAAVAWLIDTRAEGGAVWRYPGALDDGSNQDNSNAQYAMLALKGARRLGSKVPARLFAEVADYFVKQQDADGPAVDRFEVPAADGPIYEMLPIEKRAKKIAKERKKAERNKTREREGESTRSRVQARGWSYLPRGFTDEQGNPTTGSMTASGVAALCVCKSELETDRRAWSERKDAVERAIRDGCAWLARNWRVDANPSADPDQSYGWKYYYLYGVERAGVLAGTYRFGDVDWWDEGATHLLAERSDGGNWPASPLCSELVNTCFALLFLKRATIPLVPLPPKRVMTGGGKHYGE